MMSYLRFDYSFMGSKSLQLAMFLFLNRCSGSIGLLNVSAAEVGFSGLKEAKERFRADTSLPQT